MKNKYRVSLAVMTPANWETEVEADNERQAFAKAQELFEDDWGEHGELVDVGIVFGSPDLQLNYDPTDPENPDLTSGVHIEKI